MVGLPFRGQETSVSHLPYILMQSAVFRCRPPTTILILIIFPLWTDGACLQDGGTAFMAAVYSENLDIVKAMVAAGAKFNAMDNVGVVMAL